MAPPHRQFDETMAAAVSDAVSRLYLDTFGKGPLGAETFIHDDVVVTVLSDILTDAEKTLIDIGREDSVLSTRMLWQDSTEARFRGAVEKVTGRGVLAAISGFELRKQMASEVFLLAPVV